MTDIQFDDNTFDYVIASMVMEHIQQEESAIKEVLRVLKSDGKAIVSVPVALDIENIIEDKSVIEQSDRKRLYGQEDHVRLYGMDVAERWKNYGAKVERVAPQMVLNRKEISRMGVQPLYYIIILTK